MLCLEPVDHFIVFSVKHFFFFGIVLVPISYTMSQNLHPWLSEEALQIAVKRREAKSKGKKERYTHLKAEFQRIPRRDEKAFLSDQCKEIEENNRMGKTRDLFKKIRDAKGIFHVRMGTMKDRNSKDLIEAEEVARKYRRTI